MKFIITVEIKEVVEGFNSLTEGTRKQLEHIGISNTEYLKAIDSFEIGVLKKKARMEVMDWLAHNA